MQAPSIRVKTYLPVGNQLFFALPDLQNNVSSFLEADVASGATSLTANGTFFSASQYIVVGQPGQEKSEIVKISAVSSTTFTLATALVFSHNRGDVITFIEYNQIEPSRSTNGGTSFSTLTVVDIDPQMAETVLLRASDSTTDVYKFRFTNTAFVFTPTYSGYSDSVVATGYADNSVYAIKKKALDDMGERLSDLITDEFLNNALNEARRIVDQDPRVFRWSFRTKFNTDIGAIIAAGYSVDAPTDLRDRNTPKNILCLRIGKQNREVYYQDRNRFNQNYWNIAHSTLASDYAGGSTTMVLTSADDFSDSGSATVLNDSDYTTPPEVISYTGRTFAGGSGSKYYTLTGVTGCPDDQSAGNDIWQGANFGLPTYYTIDNGVIYFDVPFDTAYTRQNIYMDYYQALTPVNSDSDLLDEPFYDAYVPFLKYKIKYKKANGGIIAKNDTDYMEFMDRVTQLVTQETPSQMIQFIPTMGRGYGGGNYFKY